MSEAKRIEVEEEDLMLLLSFCPTEPPVRGLSPEFYHTLDFETERKLFERVAAIRRMVERV